MSRADLVEKAKEPLNEYHHRGPHSGDRTLADMIADAMEAHERDVRREIAAELRSIGLTSAYRFEDEVQDDIDDLQALIAKLEEQANAE